MKSYLPLALLSLALFASAPSSRADVFTDTMYRAHSHNDYQQPHPLFDALENHFYSVEADIWYRRHDLWIAHTPFPWSWKGVLRKLYLDPLQKLVNERGSVYGDGRRFYLWIDIKWNSKKLVRKLRRELSRYPMLTIYTDGSEIQRPVVVILTGNDKADKRYVNESYVRQAIRSSDKYSEKDPPSDGKWRWYSLQWSKYVHWDGRYEPPRRVARQVEEIVLVAHAKGRQVRFWDVPFSYEAWQFLLNAGVDQVSTDHLEEFNWFAHDPNWF